MKKSIFYLIILSLFFFIDFVFAQGELEVKIPGLSNDLPVLPDYIKAVFNLSLTITGLIAFFVIISGGFRYLTAGASISKMADARDRIASGILGLIIILSSYLILTTINPQLTILSLPEIDETALTALSPFDFEKNPTAYQTIPVGTIIESKILNKNDCKIIDIEHCQKLLDKDECQANEIAKCKNNCENTKDCELLKKSSDLDNILYVTKKTKEFAEKLNSLSGELRDLIEGCKCQNSNEGNCTESPCGSQNNDCFNTCNSPCVGDPCSSNRDDMERKRNQINFFTVAFESFLDETTYKGETYKTVEDFIEAFDQEIDFITLILSVRIPIDQMMYIERDNGGFKEIIENFENEYNKILIAENLMKKCPGQPLTYDDILTLEDISKEEEKEIIKENFCNDENFQIGMICDEESSILPFADSSTFYCFLK